VGSSTPDAWHCYLVGSTAPSTRLTISASPEQQGTVGMAPRMTKAFVQPVKCADPVVFAVAKRRLAPMSNEVWSVRRLPLRLVH
jgi:hypothetical protein